MVSPVTSARGLDDYSGLVIGDRVRAVRGRGKSAVGLVTRLAGMVHVALDAHGLGVFYSSNLAKLSPLELLAEEA